MIDMFESVSLVRRIILENHKSPGDTLMLTAAVRGLHRCHPATVRAGCADTESGPVAAQFGDHAAERRRSRSGAAAAGGGLEFCRRACGAVEAACFQARALVGATGGRRAGMAVSGLRR